MKKTIILAFVLVSFSLSAQEIKWMSFNEAIAAQEQNPKKIFIDAYTDWCGWCKKMDTDTFSNKDIVKYMNKNFYAVKFNAEGNETVNLNGKTYANPQYSAKRSGRNSSHELSRYFSIRGFPTMVFLDENADLISIEPGYKTPETMKPLLESYVSKK